LRLIIGLSGPAQAGKDTVANAWVASQGFTKVSLADPLREIASFYFDNERTALLLRLTEMVERYGKANGKPVSVEAHRIIADMESFPRDLDDSNPPKPRVFLQMLGDRLKKINRSIFANCLRDTLRNTPGHVVIPDIRFPYEAVVVKRNHGILIVLDRKPKLNGAMAMHNSEHAWKEIQFDFTLDSNGSAEGLLLNADILMDKIKPEYMEH